MPLNISNTTNSLSEKLIRDYPKIAACISDTVCISLIIAMMLLIIIWLLGDSMSPIKFMLYASITILGGLSLHDSIKRIIYKQESSAYFQSSLYGQVASEEMTNTPKVYPAHRYVNISQPTAFTTDQTQTTQPIPTSPTLSTQPTPVPPQYNYIYPDQYVQQQTLAPTVQQTLVPSIPQEYPAQASNLPHTQPAETQPPTVNSNDFLRHVTYKQPDTYIP